MQFEDEPLTFRFKIRELREKYGYTQKKMSELLGIERSTYTYYETGKTEPSLRVLRKMAVVFHVSTDYLVDMSDTGNSTTGLMLSPYSVSYTHLTLPTNSRV